MIRTATLADISELWSFHQGIVDNERPFDETIKPDPVEYYNLNALVVAENARVVVAEIEGKVVGCGYAEIRAAEPYHAHQQYAHLGCMFINPDYRGQGIIQQIIDALKIWSKSQNLTEVRLEVYAENAAALNAYKRAGFSPLLIEMRMGI